jgi:gliotoxin/aspirochlorine biosynthesis thioredoxin reductase
MTCGRMGCKYRFRSLIRRSADAGTRFHCLFCHGYEERGAPSAGVLAIDDCANPEAALHMARMARRLSENITIYAHGADKVADQLSSLIRHDEGIRVECRRVVKMELKSDTKDRVIVHLEDGEAAKEGFIAYRPKNRVNGPFASQLGLELTEQGIIKTTPPFNETSVKGVFAVGDCASMFPAVVNAMAMGAFTAGALAGQLQSEPVLVPAGDSEVLE